MFKFVLIISCVHLAIANPFNPLLRSMFPPFGPSQTGKIVGGEVVTIQENPWQISLINDNWHLCGGSIIGVKHVLTAAHCTRKKIAADLLVRAGSEYLRTGGWIYEVGHIHQHPLFHYVSVDFDFSVLEMAKAFEFSPVIAPIGLPNQDEDVEDGTKCFISGWGVTFNPNESRDLLRGAFVPKINQERCNEAYEKFGGITDRMMCAGYKAGGTDSCQGK